jgi:hypothetical protein
VKYLQKAEKPRKVVFLAQDLDFEQFCKRFGEITPPKADIFSVSIGKYVPQTKTQAAVNVKMEASQSSGGAQVLDSIDPYILHSQ